MKEPVTRPPTAEYRDIVSDSRRWENFEPRPGDIFVCTPPKCGTTWTQTIVAMLLFPDGNLPGPVVHLAPWLEARFLPVDEVLAILAPQTHRRSIKSHTPADGIPMRSDASYIVVGRDGRDAFMSFVNHIANMREDRVMELIASAVEDGIEPRPIPPVDDIHGFFASWLDSGALFHFMTTYWKYRDQPNVLFVHYDDLKENTEKEVRRIAGFLGIAIEEAHLPGILERVSFDWMRNHGEQIGDFDQLFTGGVKSFLFKGTNGRWRDVLSEAELASYERRSRELLPPDCKAWLDRSSGPAT
jgi:aryl sulfotransferase